jgi:hypothetical protein
VWRCGPCSAAAALRGPCSARHPGACAAVRSGDLPAGTPGALPGAGGPLPACPQALNPLLLATVARHPAPHASRNPVAPPLCSTVLAVLPQVQLQLPDDPPGMTHAVSCLLEAVQPLPPVPPQQQQQQQAVGAGRQAEPGEESGDSDEAAETEAGGRPGGGGDGGEGAPSLRLTAFATGGRVLSGLGRLERNALYPSFRCRWGRSMLSLALAVLSLPASGTCPAPFLAGALVSWASPCFVARYLPQPGLPDPPMGPPTHPPTHPHTLWHTSQLTRPPPQPPHPQPAPWPAGTRPPPRRRRCCA